MEDERTFLRDGEVNEHFVFYFYFASPLSSVYGTIFVHIMVLFYYIINTTYATLICNCSKNIAKILISIPRVLLTFWSVFNQLLSW